MVYQKYTRTWVANKWSLKGSDDGVLQSVIAVQVWG
jgi:hypothetical protein